MTTLAAKSLRIIRYKYFFTIIFLLIGVSLWAFLPRQVMVSGSVFGTYYKVIVVGNRFQTNEESLKTAIMNCLDAINNDFSTYISNSTIHKFNQLSDQYSISVSDDFYYVMGLSKRLHQLLEGAWDPTLLPLSRYYGFNDVPEEDNVQHIESFVGFHYIDLLEHNKLKKLNPNVELDLSSIVKGHAVDKVLALLKNEFNIQTGFVDIGGEIRVSGQKKWAIGIRAPKAVSELLSVIYVTDVAIATSGNYLNYNKVNDQVVGHIMDPQEFAQQLLQIMTRWTWH